MNITNAVTRLFNITCPIIQAGMVWAAGWKLASAVSNCGGLGLIGAGSMKPELLREHIRKCRAATQQPFGVNIPLLREDAADLIQAAIEEKAGIVFTSAGNPEKFIALLKQQNIIVVHVVSSVRQAVKAAGAGCDAVVGEGVEAGGHNGADEITTLCLIPQLADAVAIPIIAAGGIADGRQIAAALCLGAQAAQIGTRFAATVESSAHGRYKQLVAESRDNATVLALRKTGLVRMIKNKFAEQALQAEAEGWDAARLHELLGRKREMMGIFEGNEEEGEMEAGQSSGLVNEILTVREVFNKLSREYDTAVNILLGKL
ncbi:MAG: nitronate monooxygenase [Pseudomonadota bacterium]